MVIKNIAIKRCIAALVLSSLMLPAFSVWADDGDDDLQNQLSNVQTMMDEQQNKKAEAETIIGNVFEKLRVIQERLDAAVKEYNDISAQLKQTEEEIAKTQAALEQAQRHLADREKVLSTRIRDIYMHGCSGHRSISYLCCDRRRYGCAYGTGMDLGPAI